MDENKIDGPKPSDKPEVKAAAKPSAREEALARALHRLLSVLEEHDPIFVRMGLNVIEDPALQEARDLLKG